MLFKEKDGRVIFHIKVIGNASNTCVSGIVPVHDVMAFKIHVKAVREKGKANSAIIVFLSEILGVTKKSIMITSGETATFKTIAVLNTSLAQVQNSFKNLGFYLL